MSKRVVIPTLTLVALFAVGMVGTRMANAEELGNATPLVQRIAETFGLGEDEVQAVFDAARDERQERMQEAKQERLGQAVADGVLTQEQADTLQEKWQTMFEEKRQEMDEHRAEMDAWFEEQGIDHDALMQYGGVGGGPHQHHRFMGAPEDN